MLGKIITDDETHRFWIEEYGLLMVEFDAEGKVVDRRFAELPSERSLLDRLRKLLGLGG